MPTIGMATIALDVPAIGQQHHRQEHDGYDTKHVTAFISSHRVGAGTLGLLKQPVFFAVY